jgi:hypothetical protein
MTEDGQYDCNMMNVNFMLYTTTGGIIQEKIDWPSLALLSAPTQWST